MTTPLADPATFAGLLQKFFAERLLQQQSASLRTVAAYRDTFRLRFSYTTEALGKPPAKLAIQDFGATQVVGFLTWLETKRSNSVGTRNARVAALRAFAPYVALQCPPALQHAQQVLAIPMKRFEKPMLGYLTREEVQALPAAPPATTWCGRHDRVLFSVLYNTGARVSELIGIEVCDVTLAATASVRLHGKGRKQRTVPLWKETATGIHRWLAYAQLQPGQRLVPARNGLPMTRTNVADRLALAIAAAMQQCPRLRGRHISPHTWRYATAMHLLQAGVDITVIALWLGRASPATTHGYVEADLAMKQRALAAVAPPKAQTARYRPTDAVLHFLESL